MTTLNLIPERNFVGNFLKRNFPRPENFNQFCDYADAMGPTAE